MSDLIAHPLTGGGAYTADMYRKVVNASITPSDGTPFGALQGIRAGAATPLVETDGLKAIIHPHTGWICPWTGVGAYSYAILDDTEIDFESSSQNYKLALVLDDPSQGHGSTPQLTARIYPAATSDTTIPGIVIATITNGTANDTAPILLPQALLMARDKTQLDTITATEGQKAKTLDDDTEYLYRDGAWVSLTQSARVMVGTKVLNLRNAVDSELFNPVQLSDMAKQLGLARFDIPCISVTNGDWNTQGQRVTAASVQSGYIIVHFDAAITGPYRINWILGFAQ